MAKFQLPMPGKGYIVLLAVACGVLLGNVLVGWSYPQQGASASQPWQMEPTYQQRYLAEAANAYWQDLDALALTRAVQGWEPAALAGQLREMLTQAPDEATRLRIHAMAEALEFQALPPSLSSLLEEKPIKASALLAGSLLCAAVAVGAQPSRRLRLLVGERSPQPADEEAAEPSEASAILAEVAQTDAETTPEEAQAEGSTDPAPTGSVKAAPTAPAPAASKGATAQAVTAPPAAKEEESTESAAAGLLASVFDGSDDPSGDLAELLKGLRDVSVVDLAARCAHVSARLAGERLPTAEEEPAQLARAV
ncbi:MAG: hypothetical protein ACYC4R_16190 [Anaerolineae bacterium]